MTTMTLLNTEQETQIAARLGVLLKTLRPYLKQADAEDAREYIAHREFDVALEELCDCVQTYAIALDGMQVSLIKELAQVMGLNTRDSSVREVLQGY